MLDIASLIWISAHTQSHTAIRWLLSGIKIDTTNCAQAQAHIHTLTQREQVTIDKKKEKNASRTLSYGTSQCTLDGITPKQLSS